VAARNGEKIFGPDHPFIFHNPPISTVHGRFDYNEALQAAVLHTVQIADRQQRAIVGTLTVYDDPTVTIFPDPGKPGTTSVDGDIGTNGNASYSTAHSTADCVDCSGPSLIETENSVGDIPSVQYSVIRAELNFDTSSLGNGATVSSATMSVKTTNTNFDYCA